MYKLLHDEKSKTDYGAMLEQDGVRISFTFKDPANTDYQQFKADILAGKELQDADGKTLSQTEAEAFIATLP